MNRPEALNALSEGPMTALQNTLDAISRDPGVRAVTSIVLPAQELLVFKAISAPIRGGRKDNAARAIIGLIDGPGDGSVARDICRRGIMPTVLTEDQITAYHHDGFLSPIDVMSEDEAAEIRASLEEAEARWPEGLAGQGRNNAHLVLGCLDRLVHDPRIVDVAEDIVGPDILVNATVLFIKEAHDPGFVSWHQDGRYMGYEPMTGVTAWLALSPATIESGCMRMLPGSHAGGMREHEDTYGADNILTRGQRINDLDETKAVDLVLRPGQMSLHNQQIAHCSMPNRSDDRRIGFAIQSYFSPDMRQVVGRSLVQHVRGRVPDAHHELLPRPAADMMPEGIAARDEANAAYADILYHGAERRRAL